MTLNSRNSKLFRAGFLSGRTWSDYLRIHSETLWQCDFFSKHVWTLQGPRQIFALAFIHLATRRVFVTPGTFQSDAVWMKTTARALLDYAAAEKLPCEIVTRDCDRMFSKAFDQVFKDRSIQVKPVGPHAPNLDAFIERWIQSLRQEDVVEAPSKNEGDTVSPFRWGI